MSITAHCWSGGKDSTAAIIVDHENGNKPGLILSSEVMFDHKRGISGELPEHIEWMKGYAKPLFESWGYTVEFVRSEKDYLDIFNHRLLRSSVPERVGKKVGFPLGGRCVINRDLKMKPLQKRLRELRKEHDRVIEVVGIAANEEVRYRRLNLEKAVSTLWDFGIYEGETFGICKPYGLLSPIYEFSRRGGCWFCPNQSCCELARLKQNHPDKYNELIDLSRSEDLISPFFKYNKTFGEVDLEVDRFIQRKEMKELQVSWQDVIKK